MTIDIGRAMGLVQNYATDNIDAACVENLNLLIEVRDNCVHLTDVRPGLAKRIHEIGSASLRNFVRAAQRWFTVDLGRFNFYLMPLAFQSPGEVIADLMRPQPAAARNLLEHIAAAEAQHPSDDQREFNVTLGIELRFVRSQNPDAIPVRWSKTGTEIRLSEADVLRIWPWRYETLTQRLKDRYSDFVANNKYHKVRKPLEEDPRYCHVRRLDPESPKSGVKRWYSSAILAEFDKHYTLKTAAPAAAAAAAPPAAG
jgi:hypothetical protein